MWQLGMTIRPAPASAATHASYTAIGVDPCRSVFAARQASGTGVICCIIRRLNGSRTQLKPRPAMVSASASRCTRSRPATTASSMWAPIQFTPASLTRRPFASTMNRPLVDSGVAMPMSVPASC